MFQGEGGGRGNGICPNMSWESNGIIQARDDGDLYKAEVEVARGDRILTIFWY